MSKLNEYVVIKDDIKQPQLHKVKEHIYKVNKFLSTESIVNMMNSLFNMNTLYTEYVYALSFNSQQELLGIFEISHGSSIESSVPIRELFINLLLSGCEQFVLIHNHPNGSYKASNDDILISSRIKIIASQLGLLFDDHIIIINDGYISMSYENLF